MSYFEMLVRGLLGILPHLVLAFLVLLPLFKLVHDKITPIDDDAALRAGNAAAGINRGGAYAGFLIAMSGSLILSEETSYLSDLGMFLLDGVIALGVFAAAHYAFDWVILKKVNNARAILGGNVAVAIVELCAYLSLGLIMSASFSGGGQSIWAGMASAVLFSAIGLGTLMGVYAAYDAGWRWRRHCDVDKQIGDGNVAAAIDAGSLMLAMSITLWFSISGDFTGWWNDIASFAVAALSSILAVSIGRGLAVLVLARGLGSTGSGLHHGNVAKSAIVGLSAIGAGLVAGLVTFT